MKDSKYLVFMGMGFELVGLILGSLYLGRAIDEAYGLNGLAMVGVSMMALVGWLWHLILLTKKIEKSEGTGSGGEP